MLTISLLQSLVSLRKIFISEKFREVSAHKPSKQTLIMEDIQEKYNHLLQQNEAIRQENEELKLLLHAHGIEYKPKHAEEKDSVYSPFTFPSVKLSIEERVAIFFIPYSKAEKMFLREDGSAKQLARAVTNLSVSTSGGEAYATKRNSNVQIVLTDILRHSLTKTSIAIWKAKTRTVVMLSDCMA